MKEHYRQTCLFYVHLAFSGEETPNSHPHLVQLSVCNFCYLAGTKMIFSSCQLLSFTLWGFCVTGFIIHSLSFCKFCNISLYTTFFMNHPRKRGVVWQGPVIWLTRKQALLFHFTSQEMSESRNAHFILVR
jgi:hypothetical protein